MTLRFPAAALAVALSATFASAETPHPLMELDRESGPGRLTTLYESRPDLKEMRSSGWKPLQRLLWFGETRRSAEGTTPAQERVRAWRTANQRRSLRAGSPAWFNIGPAQMSGRTVSVGFHPTDPAIVYVGSASGGLWKTTDGGDSWTPKTDTLPTTTVGAVCVLSSNPDIVLMGTGEGSGAGFNPTGGTNLGIGLLKSTDGGDTWGTTSLSYPVSGTHGFNVIRENPTTGTILAGANDGLWRSTDEGDTWTEVQITGNFFDVKWKPGDASRVYITKGKDPFVNGQNGNGVKVSTDDGLTFAIAGTGQPSGSLIGKSKLGVSPADPSVIYVHYVNATSSWSTLGIYRSTDDGATWNVRNNSINMTGAQGWYNLALAVDPADADRVITAGVNLYVSDDGGTTFTNQSGAPFGTATVPHWDHHALESHPATGELWVGTDGGVWKSTDDGATWASRREGIVSYQYYDICVAQADDVFTLGGTQDNGLPARDTGDTWFESTFVADGMVCNISPNFSNIIYAEWQFGNQIKSTNGASSWRSIQTGLSANPGIWVTPTDQSQVNPRHLYAGVFAGIFKTTDGGNQWNSVSPHVARWISIHPPDHNYVWTVSNFQGVWVTTDAGATWTSSAGFPTTGLETKIDAHPLDPQTAFVTSGGYGTGQPKILRTTDLGASWQDVTGDFPDQPANTFLVDPVYPDHWYVGSDIGVWRSTNGGVNWAPFGASLPNVVVVDLELRLNARKLVAGTYGRGAWEIELEADPTSAGEPQVARSSALMLDPPSPNPVRDRSVLRFAARTDAPVTLEIFDVAGRRVNVVAELARGDGVIRQAAWVPDGAPAGVYFAVLSAGSERVSRKVVVAR